MYQALYRKWRPRSFDDVVSQPHITGALKNQIAQSKTAHAYLFTGSRGTGKTTCARIFAKAVNCLNPKNGEPCLECSVCKAAEEGVLSDIIEIDAASNSRVDDIRELREGVIYTPESCRFKVYIIDEVHMLSPGAFNALLKTMEEPPPHVRFILATTEVHKVPATIISRCQHFDFNRIKSADIVKRLLYIASQEGFSLDDGAAAVIARLSDGGMRDALSLLDRCSAYSDRITEETVSNAAGIAGRDRVIGLMQSIINRDTASALKIADELHAGSKDLKVLCSELLVMFRNLMLIKSTDGARELIACLPEEFDRLSEIAPTAALDRIFSCINELQQTNIRFAKTTDKRIELEMCIIRLCSAASADAAAPALRSKELNELKEQIAVLSDELQRLKTAVSAVQPAGTLKSENAREPVRSVPDTASAHSPVGSFDPSKLAPCGDWQDILEIVEKRSPAIWAFLKDSSAYIDGRVFRIVVSSELFMKKFQSSNDKTLLKQAVNEFYGKDFDFMLYPSKSVRSQTSDAQMSQSDKVSELIERAKEMNIEVDIKK